AWYPWLWIVWLNWWDRPKGRYIMTAALLVAVIFYAGNLQSHAYLPIFAMAFVAAHAGGRFRDWVRGFIITGLSGLLGALIAAPVLGPELELFRLNERFLSGPTGRWFDGILALTGAWP